MNLKIFLLKSSLLERSLSSQSTKYHKTLQRVCESLLERLRSTQTKKKKKKKRSFKTRYRKIGSQITRLIYTFEFREVEGSRATEVKIAWLIAAAFRGWWNRSRLLRWFYVPKSRDQIQRPGSISPRRCLSSAFHAALARNGLVPRRLGTRLSRTRRQSPLPAEESASRREGR